MRFLIVLVFPVLQACSTATAAADPTTFVCTQVAFIATGDASTAAFNFPITYRCTNGEAVCLVGAGGDMACTPGAK